MAKRDLEPQPLKVIDLFSGVGGFSLGAARAGFRVAAAVDNDAVMTSTYGMNFPKVNVLCESLTDLASEQILQAAGITGKERFGVIAGPPCQGMSYMGKRNPNDPRNRLFLKPFQFVKETSPSFFVIETVPGILGEKYVKLRKKALSMVPSKYTMVNNGEGVLIRACECGAPTYRRRVFYAGYIQGHFSQNGIDEDFGIERLQEDEFITASDAFYGLPSPPKVNGTSIQSDRYLEMEMLPMRRDGTFYRRARARVPNGVGYKKTINMHKKGCVSGVIPTRHSKDVASRYNELRPGERDEVSKAVRLSKNKPGPTIRAGTGSDLGSFQSVRPIHYTEPRVITPREGARIQGFPDWFFFHQTKWHSFRQIGNSVSPIVGEEILRQFYVRLKQ